MKILKYIFFTLLILVIAMIGYSAFTGSSRGPLVSAEAPHIVTIDGSDGAGGIIDPVNVWDDYTKRTAVVAKLHPGDKVILLQRAGQGAQIQTADRSRGWVTYTFIKELR